VQSAPDQGQGDEVHRQHRGCREHDRGRERAWLAGGGERQPDEERDEPDEGHPEHREADGAREA
jgi:hypothetical protein